MSFFYKVWSFFEYRKWNIFKRAGINASPFPKKGQLVAKKVENHYDLRIWYEANYQAKALRFKFEKKKPLMFHNFEGVYDVTYLNLDLSAIDENEDLSWFGKLNGVRAHILSIRLIRPASVKCLLKNNLHLLDDLIKTVDPLCIVIEVDHLQIRTLRSAIFDSKVFEGIHMLILRVIHKPPSKFNFLHLHALRFALLDTPDIVTAGEFLEEFAEERHFELDVILDGLPIDFRGMLLTLLINARSFCESITPMTLCLIESHVASTDMKALQKEVAAAFQVPKRDCYCKWYYRTLHKAHCVAIDWVMNQSWKDP